MAKTYSREAQIHSLSLIANAAFDLQEDSWQKLQDTTAKIITDCIGDNTIQGYIGNWTIVWQPVVFSNNTAAKSVVADNTMMLVYNQSENLFVVGIAGTNAVSMYGWFQEDFGVNSLVSWQSITGAQVSSKAGIAAGTDNGLQILLKMTQPGGGPSMLQALNSYVQQQHITGATVAVAGHSLGGALAPVMAMYMLDTQSSWNTVSGSITGIEAWPTAGPTPGNADFASYLSNRLGSNYTSKYNTLDVIPQAWMYSSMENIPAIYASHISPPESQAPYFTTIGLLVTAANLRTIDKSNLYGRIDYEQASPWTPMTGTFNVIANTEAGIFADGLNLRYTLGSLKPYGSYLRLLIQFLDQMLFQHTKAYNPLLGIVDVADRFNAIKKADTGSTEQERKYKALGTALSKYYGMGTPEIHTAAVQVQQAEPEEATA